MFIKNEAPALNCIYVIINFYKSDNVLLHALHSLKIASNSVEACKGYDEKKSQKCCDGFSVTFDLKHIV